MCRALGCRDLPYLASTASRFPLLGLHGCVSLDSRMSHVVVARGIIMPAVLYACSVFFIPVSNLFALDTQRCVGLESCRELPRASSSLLCSCGNVRGTTVDRRVSQARTLCHEAAVVHASGIVAYIKLSLPRARRRLQTFHFEVQSLQSPACQILTPEFIYFRDVPRSTS